MTRFSHTDLANAIRFLSIDAVEKAQSGHPGMPLGMADIATVLWKQFLQHNPQNPGWFNRDRFVLSNGHGSMLLYALLHLTGYDVSIDDLKAFRQLHSKTPGHPEHSETPGVETSTGPLGQGLANAVGMAIAEKHLAARFNKPEFSLVDHHTYTFVGDGCLMEGLSHEACSLAGTLGLGKLIVFYDDNGISIDGEVDAWFTDDTAGRFKAYHWHVVGPIDGHDPQAITSAIKTAQQVSDKPSLIICKTVIGHGANQAGTAASHGAPLGQDSITQMRERFHWPHPPFLVPDLLYAEWNQLEEGRRIEADWLAGCQAYQQKHPEDFAIFMESISGQLPENWNKISENFIEECRTLSKAEATRKSSQHCIEQFAHHLPMLLGGSADLTGSNNTDWSGTKPITHNDFSGNYLFYGVREFAMAAIMNGLALHSGIIPYGGTFLVFSDYARNAIRLSALMKQRVIYVLTHDSIGVGEDGPTHQPVEHAAMLRMTPGLDVWRPADRMETAVAWQQALSNEGPSALLLSRQNLPQMPHSSQDSTAIKRGGYILKDSNKTPDAILIATGSELHLALEAAEEIERMGKKVRVVSMPCSERFLAQDSSYQARVLPPEIRVRIAIEAASTSYWYRFVGLDGVVIGLDRFGVSSKGADAFQHLGITKGHIVFNLRKMLYLDTECSLKDAIQ